jgi:hypothetical protein
MRKGVEEEGTAGYEASERRGGGSVDGRLFLT